MHLLHQPGKQLVAGFQIPDISCTFLISGRVYIILRSFGKKFSSVRNDPAIMRINIIIILSIIFMIRGGDKERIKINHLYPQILQIIQLIHNSLKISAVKIPDIQSSRRPVPVLYLCAGRSDIYIFSVFHIICRIPVIKTVHKNLIHNGALRPVRGRKSGNNDKSIIIFDMIRYAVPVKIADLISFLYLKTIAERFGPELTFYLVEIKLSPGTSFPHGIAASSRQDIYFFHIIMRSPEPQCYFVIYFWFCRNYVILRPITEQCISVHNIKPPFKVES